MAVAALGSVSSLLPAPLGEGPVASSATPPATVFVPGGRFAVAGAWVDGRPFREAEVRPLRFGISPVNRAAYAGFLAEGGAPASPWWGDGQVLEPERAVVGVTWFEAAAFCAWLSATFGGRWRLPTEAEWEKAALASDSQLRDIGVVHEWCLDWFSPERLQPARRYDPRGPESGDLRVRRGASGRTSPRPTEWRAKVSSCRDGLDPSKRAADGGFRVVREVP